MDWYERTKDGSVAFVWPRTSIRHVAYQPTEISQRLGLETFDTSQFWMVPRRSLSRGAAWSAGALGLMIGGVGCNYLAQTSNGSLAIIAIVVILLILVIAIAFTAACSNKSGRGGAKPTTTDQGAAAADAALPAQSTAMTATAVAPTLAQDAGVLAAEARAVEVGLRWWRVW